MKRDGIIVSGNFIIDQIKVVDVFPNQDGLANIFEQVVSNGGSAYNVLKNLRRIDSKILLEAIGLLGDDANGRLIVADCLDCSIKCDQIHFSLEAATSYTDVFTVKSTGRRTFFHQRGANALLNENHFNLKNSRAKIFHLGYLLLLDQLDIIDDAGRSKASYIFEHAQNLGFKTSSDIVSVSADRFKNIVQSSLPYIDYLFLNEYEAESITGVTITKDGFLFDGMVKAGKELIKMGVKTWAIIHHPDLCIAVGCNNEVYMQASVCLPQHKIIGASGAGDAFAAGFLYGIHDSLSIQECLKIGVSVAAASLSSITCSDGLTDFSEMLEIGNLHGFRNSTTADLG